jgi:uncharacterized Ntn-hydrolase superfamily protein
MRKFWLILAVLPLVTCPAIGRGQQPAETSTRKPVEIVATFSIVAVDPDSGICGAAVASKYPAVGSVVPYVRGGVGAFCTQHYHNPAFGPRALELLAQPNSPSEILAELTRDDDRAGGRQLAIVDRHGNTAQINPIDAPPGSNWWGAASGRFYACQGNTLTGREVITAMATAYETTKGSLADRLLAALVAGDRAGGDHRGRLAAGIVVDRHREAADEEFEPGHEWLRLQVDKSDDAVTELAKKYAELEHEAKKYQPDAPARESAE